MPPALQASGIGDHFRKCSSRRLSRPVRRGRLSVTTMGIGIFSPALDEKGNGYAGIMLLQKLSEQLFLSIF